MGKIEIKEKNRGKFTAWARAHGMTVQEAANTILRNREKYSPTLIKRANFARNAARWDEGGMMDLMLPEYKSGGIHINPKNKGKFNATKKATGKTTEELTHSKNPKTRKRAIFAQNAKKWKHSEGGMVEFGIGGMVGGVIGLLQQIQQAQEQKQLMEEQAKVGAINTANAGQAGLVNNYPSVFKLGGQFKGKKFGGQPNAVVGGGEIVITPDGVPTNMQGPSDIGGPGIDVALPDKTIIISKKNSKNILPLTNKINKNSEVLKGNNSTMFAKNSAKRNLTNYYSTVYDTYNKQEAKKFDQGGGYTVGDSWKDPNLMFKDQYKVDFNLPDFNTGNQDWFKPFTPSTLKGAGAATTPVNSRFGSDHPVFTAQTDNLNIPTLSKSPIPTTADNFKLAGAPKNNVPTESGTDWGNVLAGIGEMAPMLYNLGQGLLGKRQHQNANDYANPYENQINSLMANRRYNIDPTLAANEAAFRTTAANMRNLGGSRGQVMANLTGAQNTKQFGDMAAYSQQNNVNNQYAGEQAAMLYPLGRDKSMTRMSVDEGNLMTDAAGRNMIGAGMTGLQQYLLTRRQMKNQIARDKLLTGAIKAYSPYSSKWIPGL
jgi:hypothetical protein